MAGHHVQHDTEWRLPLPDNPAGAGLTERRTGLLEDALETGAVGMGMDHKTP